MGKMTEDVRVIWEVDDGYAGRSRPQKTTIPREEWDACVTDEERDELARDVAREAFEDNIMPVVRRVEVPK